MAKRMMLLVNPNAGKAGFHAVLADILHVLCDGDWLPTVVFTKYAGEAPGIVTRHACEFDMVTCLGGDGTLSEVAAGMMRLKETLRRPIGYIPLGSTNDVARTLGISFKPVEAAKALLTGSPIHYDIGQFGFDSYFTYVAAFGAFTEVSYGTPQETKQALGHLAYMLEGIRSLGKITDYHAIVEYDGYTVAEISNPWKPGKLLHRYYLVERGKGKEEREMSFADGTVIEVPIQRAAVFTTVHLQMCRQKKMWMS